MDTNRRVHIAGLGGVGFYLGLALSRTDIGEVIGYDDDDLQGGLGSARLPLATPTTLKTDLLRGFLRASFGGRVPVLVAAKFTGREAAPGDWVVDCSDMSGVARRKVYSAVTKRGARYIRVSYDGAHSTVVVAEGLPLTGDEEHAGYSAVPSLALSLAAGGIGAEVLLRMASNNGTPDHVEFQIALSDYVRTKRTAA